MADLSAFGLLAPSDLAGFSQQVQASDPYGLIGRSLQSWQPDLTRMNAQESGVTSFGRAFLSGLAQNYAQNRAAEQLSKVVDILPQLTSDPYSVVAPEGVESSPFNILKGTAILNKASAGERRNESLADLLQKIQAAGLIKEAEVKGENKAYDDLAKGGSLNPNSPQYKAAKDAQETLDTLRDKFNKLPEVTAFSQVQRAANAMAGALKDKGAPSDLELVRYAIQMIEPGMAVREGEQQAVLKSQSIPEQWKGELSKTLENGTGIGDAAREGLKRLAARSYEAQKAGYNKALTYYQGLGEGRGYLGPGESISYLGEAPSSESIFGKLSLLDISPEQARAELARRRLASGGF